MALTKCYFTLKLFFRDGPLHLCYHFTITFTNILALIFNISLKEIINFHIFKLILLSMFLLRQWFDIIYLLQYFRICVIFAMILFSRRIKKFFSIIIQPLLFSFIHIFNMRLYFWNA